MGVEISNTAIALDVPDANPSKGFGFVERQGGPDVSAHFSAIVGDGFKTLMQGQQVQSTVFDGQKGPAAENITAI